MKMTTTTMCTVTTTFPLVYLLILHQRLYHRKHVTLYVYERGILFKLILNSS